MQYLLDSIKESIEVKNNLLKKIDTDVFLNLVERSITALKRGGKIIFAGNGGSAADSQHLSTELVSRFEMDRPPLNSIALTTDTSVLTAVGNDYGFEHLFSRQLEAVGSNLDVFIGISTSGKSKNIIEAGAFCRRRGIFCAAFAGAKGMQCDFFDTVISVPSLKTARIQECHILLGHILCGLIEQGMWKKN